MMLAEVVGVPKPKKLRDYGENFILMLWMALVPSRVGVAIGSIVDENQIRLLMQAINGRETMGTMTMIWMSSVGREDEERMRSRKTDYVHNLA